MNRKEISFKINICEFIHTFPILLIKTYAAAKIQKRIESLWAFVYCSLEPARRDEDLIPSWFMILGALSFVILYIDHKKIEFKSLRPLQCVIKKWKILFPRIIQLWNDLITSCIYVLWLLVSFQDCLHWQHAFWAKPLSKNLRKKKVNISFHFGCKLCCQNCQSKIHLFTIG